MSNNISRSYYTCCELVNLEGRILLYGTLKFKVVFVAKMFCDISQSVLKHLGHKSKGKNWVPNLRYGPQSRLVRSIYKEIQEFRNKKRY